MNLRGNAFLRTAFVLALLLLILPAPSVRAHTDVMQGDFEFVVGWIAEPPLVGALNGLDLGIHRHPSEEPVLGAEGNLTVVISTGPVFTTKALAPQTGRPGWYTFDILATRAGDYSVRIQGDLEGTAIDFTVVLETVLPRSDLEFPVVDPTAVELQDSIEAGRAETAALAALLNAVLLVAIVGVAVGAIGASLAAVVFLRLRTKP